VRCQQASHVVSLFAAKHLAYTRAFNWTTVGACVKHESNAPEISDFIVLLIVVKDPMHQVAHTLISVIAQSRHYCSNRRHEDPTTVRVLETQAALH
jgi:hypothetical protein